MFGIKNVCFYSKISIFWHFFGWAVRLTHLSSVHRICSPSGHGRCKIVVHGGPVTQLAGVGGPETPDAASAFLIPCIDFEGPILVQVLALGIFSWHIYEEISFIPTLPNWKKARIDVKSFYFFENTWAQNKIPSTFVNLTISKCSTYNSGIDVPKNILNHSLRVNRKCPHWWAHSQSTNSHKK